MAQENNPFYVEPLGGYSVSEGLRGLRDAMFKREQLDAMAEQRQFSNEMAQSQEGRLQSQEGRQQGAYDQNMLTAETKQQKAQDSIELLKYHTMPDGDAKVLYGQNLVANNGEVDQADLDAPLNMVAAEVSRWLPENVVNKALGVTADHGSSVKETMWFLQQTPEVQEAHLRVKRKHDPTFADKLSYEKEKAKIQSEQDLETQEEEFKQSLKYKPKIITATKLAEKSAAERGEVLTDLARSQAAMPQLLNTVQDLKGLAEVATSTWGGSLWDTAVKQTGFGATDGATAKAKFIAIINNQVLPLLKPTFGAAFTAQEGETLKRTMGDPDGTVEEKLAQLDAFIAQKYRDIESKQNQLDQKKSGAGVSRSTDARVLKEGTTAIGPNGQRMIVRNKRWEKI